MRLHVEALPGGLSQGGAVLPLSINCSMILYEMTLRNSNTLVVKPTGFTYPSTWQANSNGPNDPSSSSPTTQTLANLPPQPLHFQALAMKTAQGDSKSPHQYGGLAQTN